METTNLCVKHWFTHTFKCADPTCGVEVGRLHASAHAPNVIGVEVLAQGWTSELLTLTDDDIAAMFEEIKYDEEDWDSVDGEALDPMFNMSKWNCCGKCKPAFLRFGGMERLIDLQDFEHKTEVVHILPWNKARELYPKQTKQFGS